MRLPSLATVLLALHTSCAATTPTPTEVQLWVDGPPGKIDGSGPGADDGTGRFWNVGVPSAFVYLPETPAPEGGRMALIACPGGGYTHLTRLLGADGAVEAFLPKNVAVIALRYRTTPPSTEIEKDALEDGKRAVRLVRAHAAEWGINPNRIGMVGWSAGANLCLTVASRYQDARPEAADPLDRLSSRPDFVILLSPWPAKRAAADYPIRAGAPAALIASARDDKTAPTSFAEGIAKSYLAAGAPHMLWITETGGHGAFTINAPGEGGQWIERFLPWIEAQKLLR